METGRTGVNGPLVTSHVELVFRRVDEIALIQNQHLAAKYVLVIKRKLETVNLGTVKVCISLMNFHFVLSIGELKCSPVCSATLSVYNDLLI